ncbi:gamma-glutamyl-gamma-aminobutyrate hydrolase family protein [Steroidobacter denitrificans]|uniref:gamma-glutamyl-gamma-aminobutyrate hydrolase family protein n=1 Tax=Steroidobacter denitrificans TaxID=465721 RepID=UPI001AEF71C4|nr:gamma-glutamyl-gamma-aminobutyrate hydrolase family protein [Steroidobacter denitrificans]
MPTRKPLIGIPADRRLLGNHYFHCVGEKYIQAVVQGAGALPVLIPSLGEGLGDMNELLENFDGILLTGSPSNVEPYRYQGPASAPGTLHDTHRDSTTLEMIPAVVAAGLPLLAICRGFQEMNVAFGGSLWQNLHEAGLRDHREDPQAPLDMQYGPAHEVELVPEGLLHRLAGAARLKVNSLHTQGVQRLGDGLEVEARAVGDGLVEAFRVRNAPGFALGLQWHPEWKFQDNPFSRALFAAFGEAARARVRGSIPQGIYS